MVVQLLNLGLDWAAPGERRRVWLQPGVPLLIGARLAMTLHCVREVGREEERELVVRVQGPGVQFEAPVPASCWVDLASLAGLQMIPRAMEMGGRAPGYPTRLLLEFVRTRRGVQWAV